MRKITVLLVLILAVSLTSSGAAAEEPEVKFGVLLPLSGDVANYGTDARRAIELALEDLALDPVYRDWRFRAVYEDGRCQGAAALSAVRKLLRDKVTAVVAGGCSGEVLGAAPAVEQSQVVLLASFASSPDVSNAGRFIFRVAPSDQEGGAAVLRLLTQDKRRRVALLSENTDYALGVRNVLRDGLAALGQRAVVDETYNSDLNDFRLLLLKFRREKPDALFVNPQSGLKAGLIVRQLRELQWEVPLYGTFAFSSADAVAAVGDKKALEGLKFSDAPTISSEQGRAFVDRFRARFGREQSSFHIVFTYDAIRLLAQAYKEVGGGDAMREYLHQLPEFQGLSHTFSFDANGDVVGVPFATFVYRNGEVVEL